MKIKILGIFSIFFCCFVFLTDCKASTKVKFDSDVYNIQNGTEYSSNKNIKWITIPSDRQQPRIFLEIDISLIKEYDSSNGKISYKAIKNWLNNLEKVYSYFSELNLTPRFNSINLEFTGISRQFASAYVGSGNRVVFNKEYHLASLEIIERDYNNGISNLLGTALHEMGHLFTKSGQYSDNFNVPWNFGTEYINMLMVQYVLDKMVENNDNIVSKIYTYDDVICASKNIKSYNYLNGNSVDIAYSFKDGWGLVHNKYKYFNPNDPSYSMVIYNMSIILDKIGRENVKKVFNYYCNNYDSVSYLSSKDDYTKFNKFIETIKSKTNSVTWNSLNENYNDLYNKFVVNILPYSSSLKIVKGSKFNLLYDVTYNNEHHDKYAPLIDLYNKNILSLNEDGSINADNIGDTSMAIQVGNQYKVITVSVVDGIKISKIKLSETKHVFNSYNESYKPKLEINPSNATNKTIIWKSSDNDVARVSSDGTVKSQKNGKCKIIGYSMDGSNVTVSYDVIVDIKAKSVALNKTSMQITSQNSINKLVATVTPSQASQKVAWSSSNGKIATVDSKGRVKAVSNGKCKIIATTTDGTNRTASCDVTVDIKFVTGISFDFNSYTITNVNQTPVFRPNITPSDAEDKNVRWSSSNTKVATVSSSGVIKAAGNGTCKITATTTDGTNLSASFNITVNIKATKITMDKTKIELTTGKETEKITSSIEPSIANKAVKYTSSDESIATVSSDGVVTAVGSGTCRITAAPTDGSKVTASCDVTVDIKTTGMKLDKTNYTFNKAQTIKINPVITPSKASKKLTWTSSNTKVAIVSSDGKVTPVGKGTCKITATVGNVKAEKEVKVVVPIESVSLSGDDSILKGETKRLTATINPEDTTDDKTITWSSDNENVLFVDQNGQIRGIKEGTANVKAVVAGKETTKQITVNEIHINSIAIDGDQEFEMIKNQTKNLSVTINPENTTDDKGVVWKTNNEKVARVDNDGKVTALKEGEATITATVGTNETSVKINVKEIHINSVVINELDDEFTRGDEFKFSATYTPENTTDENKTVEWSSSNTDVGTIDQEGNFVALKEGTTKITAKIGNIKAEREVTVIENHVGDFKLLQEEGEVLNIGNTQKLVTVVNPENCTDAYTIKYSSSDEAIATVDENGNVTALKDGKVVITATLTTEYDEEFEDSIEINIPAKEVISNKAEDGTTKGAATQEATSPKTGDVTFVLVSVLMLGAATTLVVTKRRSVKQK